ncbi:MAG TPA: hypothetical protein VN965_09980 [Candidatus Dormibacteraeota bacterium]|nr:hypothetical protein [Candidatus Dormibacteraeota bacterium]
MGTRFGEEGRKVVLFELEAARDRIDADDFAGTRRRCCRRSRFYPELCYVRSQL